MLITGVLLAIIALLTIFSVQNASPVAVSFLFWRFDASLAIVIFLSVLSGVVIAVIAGFTGKVRRTATKHKKHGDRSAYE